MYEIVMSTGDRAECDTIEACLVTARTLRDDAGAAASTPVIVVRIEHSDGPRAFSQADSAALRWTLNRHLREVREAATA